MTRGILRWTRDSDTGRPSKQLTMYPAQTAFEQYRNMLNAEVICLGRTWGVVIGSALHQHSKRDDAEFEFLSARYAELV